jgi:hypothetical protein
MDKSLSAMPPELVEIEQRLRAWRGSHNRGKRIPESLWREAATIAIKVGVHRTKRWLGLDYYSLKKHVDAVQGKPVSETPSSNRLSPGKRWSAEQLDFVQLPAPAAWVNECIIELQDGRGSSMRMQLKGTEYPDIVGACRSFWSGG